MKTEPRKLAMITGASSGIGFELARVFAKNNYDLIINSSSNSLMDKVDELKDLGVEVTGVIADLATREGAEELYMKANYAGRPIDVLVLNAGVAVGGEFLENDFEDELNLMNLNMVYLVYLAKKVMKDMAQRNEGKVLFTSSIAAEMPGPYYATYAASKSFVQSFAEAIRYEMKDTGRNITVTALQPGPTDTNFFERGNMEHTMVGESDSKDDPAQVAQDGYEALMKGKDHVIGGSIKNSIQAAAAKVMSEKQRASIHGNMTKPDSMKQ